MNKIKYVMFSEIVPVLFLDMINHTEMEFCGYGKITSAGFVQITIEDGQIVAHTYGESQGLKLKSDPKDADIITLMLRR